jgi:hypothetical protein
MPDEQNAMAINSAKLNVALNNELKTRNTITINDFIKYRPLFTINGDKDMTKGDFKTLAEEWQRRISIFHKVDIVENYATTDGSHNIFFTLPPMFVGVDAINKATDKANQVITMFDGAMTRNNPLSTDKEAALDLMKNCVTLAQDKKRVGDNMQEYTKLMIRLNAQQSSDGLTSIGGTSQSSKKVDTTVIDDWS